MLQCVVSVVDCKKSNNLPSLNCLASPLRWEQGWLCATGPGAPKAARGASRAWSRAGPRRGAQQRPKKGGRQVSHPKLATPKFLMRQGGNLQGICKEWLILNTTDDNHCVPRTPGFLVCTLNCWNPHDVSQEMINSVLKHQHYNINRNRNLVNVQILLGIFLLK